MVGHWHDTPLSAFSDAMVETAAGHRVLLAPHREAADFIAATYVFDEVRIEAVTADVAGGVLSVRSPSLTLEARTGRRTPLGHLLALVPDCVAAAPWFCALTDPVARVALRGVRTRGSAAGGRREYYGATDTRAVVSLTGSFEGRDLGGLAPVDPPCRFGFSSTPRRPSITDVVTTVDLP